MMKAKAIAVDGIDNVAALIAWLLAASSCLMILQLLF